MIDAPYRDDASHVLPVRLDAGAADRGAAALRVLVAALPGWRDVTAPQVAVRVVSGGITNTLWRVSAPGRADVLVRGYGPRTDVVIDRERENHLFARLSAAGFAPPYLARFENGRVEGFLGQYRPLEPQEMGEPRWRRRIAVRLAELHGFAPPVPAARTFETLSGWMAAARACRFEGADAARFAALDLEAAADALDGLREHWDTVLGGGVGTPGGRVVLAHNDLLSGNVLVDERTDEVRFIDYEYGDAGFAAFDLANHFCEYAGFDSDFARGFPDAATRADVVAAYLGAAPGSAAVDDFDRLVRFFVLVDHLWWGSWAVVQARNSPIDFDFMGYAGLRLAGLAFHTARWGPFGVNR